MPRTDLTPLSFLFPKIYPSRTELQDLLDCELLARSGQTNNALCKPQLTINRLPQNSHNLLTGCLILLVATPAQDQSGTLSTPSIFALTLKGPHRNCVGFSSLFLFPSTLVCYFIRLYCRDVWIQQILHCPQPKMLPNYGWTMLFAFMNSQTT